MARANPNTHTRKPAVVLTRDEVVKMEQRWRATSITGARNRALISTLFRTQVRVSELVSLRLDDVDLSNGLIRVAFGKGDKIRTVGMPATGIVPLQRWLDFRNNHERIQESGSEWLFCQFQGDHAGQKMDRKRVWEMIKDTGEEVLGKRSYPHCLRHSGASLLLEYDVPLLTIQAQLGHKNLGTTFNYLHALNPKQIKEQIANAKIF